MMRMLGTTPSGDAYTFAEIEQMLREAGFEARAGAFGSRAPAAYSLFSRRLIRSSTLLCQLNSRRLPPSDLRPALRFRTRLQIV